jgi:hypothetical protein
MNRFKPKTTFADLSRGLVLLNDSFRLVSVSAEEASVAFQKLTQEIRKIIPKEYKIMELKLLKLETRLHVLEHRSTECEAIRKKLRRQIRNLKAAMAV